MTVVAVGSLKASPGATTAMLALAAVWPAARPVLLVEADPDGGVLAARFKLSTEPGLVSVAPALRRDASPELVAGYTQVLPGGTPVLVGPASADQARVSLAGCAVRLAGALAAAGERGDAIVDCGRLSVGSPALPLLAAADTLLVVARPRVEELQYLAHRLPALRRDADRVGLLLVGEGPYRPGEIVEALGGGLGLVARLPHDPRAAAALNGAAGGGVRRLAQSGLIRAAREVVGQLHTPAAAAPQVPPVPAAQELGAVAT